MGIWLTIFKFQNKTTHKQNGRGIWHYESFKNDVVDVKYTSAVIEIKMTPLKNLDSCWNVGGMTFSRFHLFSLVCCLDAIDHTKTKL